MKTVTLNVPERLQLVSFLNSFQGKDFSTLNEVWKLLDKVNIKEDEKTALGLKIEGQKGEQTLVWDKDAEQDKDIEFTADEEKAFLEEFEERSKNKKLGVELYNLAQVYIKLKEFK